MVTPRDLMRLSSSPALASCSVRPPAISSSSSSFGRVASARASSSRLRSSRVSPPAGLLACASSPVCSSTSCAVSQASRSVWPRAEAGGGDEILEHRHVAEGLRHLVAAADAGAAALVRLAVRVTSRPSYSTRPASTRTSPRDQVEQRRLAGAVRPEDAQRLAFRHRQRDVVGDLERAVGLAHAMKREQRHASSFRVPPVGMLFAASLLTMVSS